MTQETIGANHAQSFLEHYGVKGMKWGVRRDKTPTVVTTKVQPGRRVKAKGGKFQDPAEDAVTAAKLRQQARKSTTDSLSNKELQALVTRMNLEEQYDRLSKSDVRLNKGARVAKSLLKNVDGDSAVSIVAAGAAKAGGTISPPVASGIRLGAGIVKAVAGGNSGQQKKKKK